MPGNIPTVGENKFAERMFDTNMTIKLYVNNITPADADTAATYTEMSTLGYAAKTLTGGGAVITQASSEALATYPEQTWTFTAGAAVTIYGYYIIDTASGVLLGSEKFASPTVKQFAGDEVKIVPTLTVGKKV